MDGEGFEKADREFFVSVLRGVVAQNEVLQSICNVISTAHSASCLHRGLRAAGRSV